MKCPHCLVEIHPDINKHFVNGDSEGQHRIDQIICPACNKSVFILHFFANLKYCDVNNLSNNSYITNSIVMYPKGVSRSPCSTDIPERFSSDYKEACLVLQDSPKASAALCRRCLQNILQECTDIKHQDLSKEIQEIIDRRLLPSHLLDSLDAVRNIGNFAAHPLKSTSTGEIVPVEPGEAEWCLDVLEGLLDHFFIQPANTARKKAVLDAKLKDLGKPPMK